MNKIYGILSFIVFSSTFLTAQNNLMDSLSYSIGVVLAQNIKDQGITNVDMDVVTQAMVDFSKGESQMERTQAEGIFGEEIQKIQQAKTEMAKGEGEAFLAENAMKEGVVTLPSGLQYKIVKPGNGPKPTLENKVKVHYHGTMIDGQVFDSSVERGEPISFPLNGVIQGWQEGLQQMPLGAKYMLYIPQDLAYGARGAGQVIKPYSALVFEVELLGIE